MELFDLDVSIELLLDAFFIWGLTPDWCYVVLL